MREMIENKCSFSKTKKKTTNKSQPGKANDIHKHTTISSHSAETEEGDTYVQDRGRWIRAFGNLKKQREKERD